ncbi:hypothetical protein CGLAUT_10710 [Corynebacterium glaucum]|uniref:acetyl-CoA acetyltransferase n=1 Tax=Corynebacterium glaucum TaxID=187491 RepID=UPI0025B42E8D|nr:acetyl-CoA acetyltransferase [Corynebacterium glaucum]WJZ08600.1 hypothetical protein CGLAUT_10710 [Corynebacterium glaucum]
MFTATATSTAATHTDRTHSLHGALHLLSTAHPHLEGHPQHAPHAEPAEQHIEPDPLKARYEIDANLPRELRHEARDMDWGLFIATYAPEPTLKVTLTACKQKDWMKSEYSFDVYASPKASASRNFHETIEATGPVRAISQLLDRHRRYVEILAFHQIEIFEATATCLKIGHSERDHRKAWVIGFGGTPEASAAAAMSAGAQRIHGNL